MAETFLYQGKHLLVDAACKNHDALVNLRLGQDCLEAVVESIGVTQWVGTNANGELHRVLKTSSRGSGRADGPIAAATAPRPRGFELRILDFCHDR